MIIDISIHQSPLGSILATLLFVYLLSSGILLRVLNMLFFGLWIMTLAAPFFLKPLVQNLQQQQNKQYQQYQQQQQQQQQQYGQNYRNQNYNNNNNSNSNNGRGSSGNGFDDNDGIVIDADWKEVEKDR